MSNERMEFKIREYKNYPEKLFSRKENKKFLEETRKIINKFSKKVFPPVSIELKAKCLAYRVYCEMKNNFEMYYHDGTKVIDEPKFLYDGLYEFFYFGKTTKEFINTISISILGYVK